MRYTSENSGLLSQNSIMFFKDNIAKSYDQTTKKSAGIRQAFSKTMIILFTLFVFQICNLVTSRLC
jgi:hypothetical protein